MSIDISGPVDLVMQEDGIEVLEVGTLVWLPPAELVVRLDQVRSDLGDLSGLVASMKVLGVLEPLAINENKEVIAGQRRRSAAIEAELDVVPCFVVAGTEESTYVVSAGLVENEHRKDLTLTELIEGYTQLRLAGATTKDIAVLTSTPNARVAKLVKVGKSDRTVEATAAWNLTLEQAAQLAEFADDDDAVARLERAQAQGNSGGWDHAVSRLRQDRKDAKEKAKLRAALEAEGYTVYDTFEEFPEGSILIGRRKLLEKEGGEPVTAENHQTCEGRGALLLDDWGQSNWYPVCVDPTTYHFVPEAVTNTSYTGQSRQSDRGADGKLTEQAKAERKAIREGNKAWRAATPVRQDFLRKLLSAKTTPAGILRWAVEEIALFPGGVNDGHDDDLAGLLGGKVSTTRYGAPAQILPRALRTSRDARLGLLLFAQVAASYENRLAGTQDGGVHNWQSLDYSCARNARYLCYLAELGYGVSEIEATIITAAAAIAEREAKYEAEGWPG